MKRLSLIFTVLFFTFNSLSAKTYIGANNGGLSNNNQGNSGKTGVFDCATSSSQIDLDINNVRTRILGGGDMWWDGVETAKYELPKIDASSGATSISALFTGALWFTGLDNGGNLQCSAQTYRNQGHDFFTGPLNGIYGEASFDVCAAYDEHFEVLAEEINEVRALFADGGGANIPSSLIPANVLKWPGKGNPYYLSNETDKYYNEGALAPFFDQDGNNIYDPTKGDFPIIGVSKNGVLQPTYADQMIFWVINDNGQIHGRTGGVPIGVQVNCLAFAYSTADALNDMTFYTFEITKKTPNPLYETYMGYFVDTDLGDATDDYIGCDTVRDMGYVYNSTAVDGQYGPNPPIVGIDYFEGPLADDGTELGLSSFVYFVNSQSSPQSDPDVAVEFRNYQTGLWKDGNPIVFGGNGYIGTTPTNYVFPGNPADGAGWSMVSANIPADDIRFVQNSGPFTLVPGQTQRITLGVVAVFPSNYTGVPDIDKEIGIADDLAQNLFDNNFDIIDGPDAPTLAIRELPNKLIINLVNETSSNNFGEKYLEKHALPDNGVVGNDSLYKFQGYKVYQLKNETVTAQDLNDESKAKLIYQSDVKDDISKVYNYVNNDVGGYNAIEQVVGSNEGINRTIVITDDAFATGASALVNNKKYYFAAIAYATSDYEVYPTISTLPDLEIFKQGRGNFKIYSAFPHVIDSRNGGTVLQAEAGDPLSVFRFEGEGNGGVAIKLNEATENAILSSSLSFADVLEYELGFDPIQAKVVDPLKLQNVDFELRFESYDEDFDTIIVGVDTTINRIYNPNFTTFSDSSYWKLFVYNEAGTLVDTIVADRNYDGEYQQIVPEYGISLRVNIPTSSGVNLRTNAPFYGPISSELTFEDNTKAWLSFISDDGYSTPNNWIRSGSEVSANTLSKNIFNSNRYDDLTGPNSQEFYDPAVNEETIFGSSLLNGQIAPYCLTANFGDPDLIYPTAAQLQTNPGLLGPIKYTHGPGFRWEIWNVNTNNNANIVKNPRNNLEELRSVTIVMTPDVTKWSDCVVFETGEDFNATTFNVAKGDIRRDAQGNAQIGKFPGYAINLETGERLNIAFGEASTLSAYNGNDLIWNPTSDIEDVNTPIVGPGITANTPIWGGKHFVYVMNTKYDNGQDAFNTLDANPISTNSGATISSQVADLYDDIIYTFIPVVNEGFEFATPQNIPTEARINLNINRPFLPFATAETSTPESNSTMPRYRFSTIGLAPLENEAEVAESALDNIRVVPNPYYAYSAYEENQIDNVVKIIGLPDRCEVKIFSLDGKLVRTFNRAVGSSSNVASNSQEISSGQAVGTGINLDNSISWDLNNAQRIPVGSATYIIHVNAFDLGEKVTKAVIFMRPTDVSNF